jgi:hypothetical protein
LQLKAFSCVRPTCPAPWSPTDTTGSDSYHWRRAWPSIRRAVCFRWGEAEAGGGSDEVIRALELYSRSRDPEVLLANRFCALEASLSILKSLCAVEPTRLRLASLARTAHDLGERASSVYALNSLLAYIHKNGVDVSEPFLAPLERFDSIVPDADAVRWLVAAVLEQLEHRERFSSFYAGRMRVSGSKTSKRWGSAVEMTSPWTWFVGALAANAPRRTPECLVCQPHSTVAHDHRLYANLSPFCKSWSLAFQLLPAAALERRIAQRPALSEQISRRRRSTYRNLRYQYPNVGYAQPDDVRAKAFVSVGEGDARESGTRGGGTAACAWSRSLPRLT